MDKEEFIFNSHGSHASKYPYDVKESRLRLNSTAGKPELPNIDSYLSHKNNKKLGEEDKEDWQSKYLHRKDTSNLIDSDKYHEERINKLQELHPISNKTKETFKTYSKGSAHVTDLSLGKLNRANSPIKHYSAVKLDNNIKQHGHMPLQTSKLDTYTGTGFDIRNVKSVGTTKEGHPVYNQPAHLSSSIDKGVAKHFANMSAKNEALPERHILHWHHEKGQPVGVVGKNSKFSHEHEVLIPSTQSHENNYHIAHLGTERYKDPESNRIYNIHHVKRIPESEIVKG